MRILFIGNSHTYGYGMPYQCRELLRALGIEAQVSMVAQPGEPLLWHAENATSQHALRYDTWDHIIIQQAAHPFRGRDALFDGVRALRKMMPKDQSLWLYKTWCEKGKFEDQVTVDRLFAELSDSQGVPLIPVSDAWHAVEGRDPGHELYDTDGAHAGRGGSYVTALCVTRALSGRSVQGLPSTLRHGKRLINRVSESAAALYQEAVDDCIAITCPGGSGTQ